MKALVKTAKGPGNLMLKDVPIPSISENEVLISVEACGICGTDLKIEQDTFAYIPPVIIGHEFSGIIQDIGPAVENWNIGDRVVAEQHFGSCGYCEFCLTGRRQFCSKKRSPGYYSDGAFAEYIAIPASLLHSIPENVSMQEAALIEPMAIAASAVLGKAGVVPGDTVVILGAGPISLLTLQLVRQAGAGTVLLTGLEADKKVRFGYAEAFGADLCIQADVVDPILAVMDATKGRGADLVVDLSGSPPAIISGLSMLHKNGRFCAVGLPQNPVTLPWAELVLKAQTIFFSYSSDYPAWELCLSLLSRKKILTNGFLDNQFILNDWKQAFQTAHAGEALKVIILPQKTKE